MKDVNDVDFVLSSSGVVLEVNDRGIVFHKIMRDLVEIFYRHNFHLQYKNQTNDSNIIVLFIFQEDYENSKGQMRVKPIQASKDVQKMLEKQDRGAIK
jgi:hypothetical protein